MAKKKEKKKFRVLVNRDYCKLCGICVGGCPVKTLSIEDQRVVEAGRCIGCRTCERFCPDFAITVEEDNG